MFSLVTARLLGHRTKGKTSSCLYIEDPQQSLSQEMPFPEASWNSKLMGPMSVFCPMVIPFYDNTKDTEKGKQRQSLGENESITKDYSIKFLPRVAKPKDFVP